MVNKGSPVQEKLQPYVAQIQTGTRIQDVEILNKWGQEYGRGYGNFLPIKFSIYANPHCSH